MFSGFKVVGRQLDADQHGNGGIAVCSNCSSEEQRRLHLKVHSARIVDRSFLIRIRHRRSSEGNELFLLDCMTANDDLEPEIFRPVNQPLRLALDINDSYLIPLSEDVVALSSGASCCEKMKCFANPEAVHTFSIVVLPT